MTGTDEAVHYVTNHCRFMGSYAGDFSPFRFLGRVAKEMAAARPTAVFPVGHKEHVAYALGVIAGNHPTTPPTVLATVYLVTQLEFCFRLLSGKLKADGEWVDAAAKDAAKAGLPGVKGLNGDRVSRVETTYKVMKLDQSRPAAQVFDSLDKALFAVPIRAITDRVIADVGDRIGFIRNIACHGHWGDVSAEGVFCGLVTTIVFYNQNY
jgi:hypothetical protein